MTQTNYSKPSRPWSEICRVTGGEGDRLKATEGIQNALSSRRANPGRRRRTPSQGQSGLQWPLLWNRVGVRSDETMLFCFFLPVCHCNDHIILCNTAKLKKQSYYLFGNFNIHRNSSAQVGNVGCIIGRLCSKQFKK